MIQQNPPPRAPDVAPADTARHLGSVKMYQLAEERAAAMEAQGQDPLSPAETRRILHEFRVQQIQLEVQNEELRQAQAELDVMRARYFDLYDLAPVGYCTVSEEGLILEANLTAATLLGLTRPQLVRQPVTRFILREDEDIYDRHHRQLWATRHPQTCELRMLHQNGAPLWAHLEATIAEDSDGVAVCRVVLNDITERRQAEKLLCESEAKYRAIFENMAAACCLDEVIYRQGRPVDYRLLDINPAFARITGIPRSRAVGALASVLYGTGEAPFLDVYSKVAETGVPASFEAYFAPLQKHLFVTVGCPEPGRFSTVFSDVTEAKRVQDALHDSEARFRLLVESSPDAVFVQTEGRFAYLNEAAVHLFGAVTADDLLGQPVTERCHPDYRGMVGQRIRQLNEQKSSLPRAELVYLRLDGTPVPVEVSAGPMRFQGSDGALVFARNIAVRKQNEAKLTEQLHELQRWYDITLGREGRIMELKREVNELLTGVGRAPRYLSVVGELAGSEP